MPGMPIFQESPGQLKSQIYVFDTDANEVVELKVDATGSLSVNGSVGLEAGAEVALAAGSEVALAAGTEVALAAGTDIDTVTSVTTLGTVTNDVKIVNGASALTVGLAAGSEVALAAGTEVALAAGTDIDNVATVTTLGTVTNDVKIINGASALTVGLAAGSEVALAAGTEVALAAGTEVALAAGTDIDTVTSVTTLGTVTNDVKIINGASALSVGLAAGSNIIGQVQNDLVFTNVDSFGGATPLTSKDVGLGATVEADEQDISKESSYNWFIKNTGTLLTQDITLVVEISPDGITWINDTGTIISLAHGVGRMITVTNFLKYARFVITGGLADTTVISCFQAQH